MEDEAWNFTFIANKSYIPADQRITAVLKYAKARGLRVTKRPLRLEVIEECCRALCPECAQGKPVARDPPGVWCHNKATTQCQAHKLREALYQRATVKSG